MLPGMDYEMVLVTDPHTSYRNKIATLKEKHAAMLFVFFSVPLKILYISFCWS